MLWRLLRYGWDWVFLDGPPNFLTVIDEMIKAADFVLIPVKPSMIDILATQDAVAMAREADATFAVVFNEVGPRERIVDKARELLFSVDVPILDTAIVRRTSHITGMTVGKSAAEVNGGKDTAAADEIDALWREVKAAPTRRRAARSGRPPVGESEEGMDFVGRSATSSRRPRTPPSGSKPSARQT